MGLVGKSALSGAVVAAATLGVLAATGVFTGSGAPARAAAHPANAAHARAGALTAFDSCDSLLDWYLTHNLSDVGPDGWKYAGVYFDQVGGLDTKGTLGQRGSDLAATVPGALTPQSGSLTGTNTQEAAVDEADVAKTNGRLVVRIVDDNKLVLVDVSGAEPRVTHRLLLPKDGYDNQLLLLGNHVLITQQTYTRFQPDGPPGPLEDRIMQYNVSRTTTRVLDVDISDPTNPMILSADVYSGSLLAARQYGDTVRLVTSTTRPDLAWVHPDKHRTQEQATLLNRELLQSTNISQWLPSVVSGGRRSTLTDCKDVLHPADFSGSTTTAVVTFGIGQDDRRTAVGITASGNEVYSSPTRLYIASSEFNGESGVKFAGPASVQGNATWIHSFDVSGASTTSYVGSGIVDGALKDRWSLDEYAGRLRVAWTRIGKHGHPHNGITIFAEANGTLKPTATIGGLGTNENLQAVRWFDHLAVLVTYRQIDPLYTIDLTNQDHPKLLGVLKIPGYSGYLHPISDHLLLGLGTRVLHGETYGAQAAVFDVSDLRHPIQVSKVSFGPYTNLPAIDDPYTFTWDPSASVALTPVQNWNGAGQNGGGARLVSLHVSPAGQLVPRTVVGLNDGWAARTFVLPDGRLAVLDGHRVRLVSN